MLLFIERHVKYFLNFDIIYTILNFNFVVIFAN